MSKFIKLPEVSLKQSAEFNEKWVQNVIAQDPEIIGLGKLHLRDMERVQPKAGRLDLLLQDNADTRYEVEIQLGKVDESHIIRTIEYWDIERNRYPGYNHVAVLIAEEITSRFLNVISLFHKAIPLIAIQMKAVKVGDDVSLIFTKVLDWTPADAGNDEEVALPNTDRNYWETEKSATETVSLADKLLALVSEIALGYSLQYNKYYICLAKDGRPSNFVRFMPLKQAIHFFVKLPESDDFNTMLDDTSLDWTYYYRWKTFYKISLQAADIEAHADLLKKLVQAAYENAQNAAA